MKKLQNLLSKVVIDRCCKTESSLLFHKITSEWDCIVGEDWKKITKPIEVKSSKFKYGGGDSGACIVVAVRNPSFVGELSLQEKNMIGKINMYCGYNAISKIRFVSDKRCFSEDT